MSGAGGGRRISGGWRLVVLAGLVMFAVQAPGDYPVLMLIMSSELWDDGYTGFASAWGGIPDLLPLVGLGAVILAAGYVTDRFGPRRAILAGLWAVAVWGVLLGLSKSLWALQIAAFMIAAGGYSGGLIPFTVLLCRRFFRRRAAAIAAAIAIAALLGAVGAQIFFYLLLPDFNHYWATKDWQVSGGVGRWASLAVFAALFLIAAWFAFARLGNRPEDAARHPDGEGGMEPRFSFTIAQCLRTRSFWFIVIGTACTSITTSTAFVAGITTQVPGLDYGSILGSYSERFQLESIIYYQYIIIGFVLLGGWLSDRGKVPKYRLLAFFSVLQAIGIMISLVGLINTSVAIISFVLIAMGEGGRIPVNAAILAEYFGLNSLGKILGLSIVISEIATVVFRYLLPRIIVVIFSTFFDNGWGLGGLGIAVISLTLLASFVTLLGALPYWLAKPPPNSAPAAA